MDVAGHHFLAGAAFAGDQDRGVGAGDLVGELDDARPWLGRRYRTSRWIRRQPPRAPRRSARRRRQRDDIPWRRRGSRSTARRHRCRCRRRRPGCRCVRHRGRRSGRRCPASRRPAPDRRRGRRAGWPARSRSMAACATLAPPSMASLVAVAELALEGADDEKTHGSSLRLGRPALMISVMVTPSRFSTRTTSPRATRRSLT